MENGAVEAGACAGHHERGYEWWWRVYISGSGSGLHPRPVSWPGPAWDHRPVGCCARPRPPPLPTTTATCPTVGPELPNSNINQLTHQHCNHSKYLGGLKIFETNSLRKSTKLNSSKSEHFCENFHYRVILTEPEFKQDTLFKLTAREQKSVLEIEDESKYWGNTNNPNQLFVQINYPWFPFSIKIYYHKIRIMVVRNEVGAF